MTEEERVAADKARKDAEEKETAERDDRARKDAEAGEKLDKILSHLGEINKRVDALEGYKCDDDDDDKAKDDDDDKEDGKAEGKEEGEPKMTVADKARKDAEEEVKKAREEADAARKDAAELSKRLDELSKVAVRHMSDEERASLASIHAKADKVYAAFGDSASFAMPGEDALSYRRRLANGLRKHSAIFSKIDLASFGDEALATAETQIYADAQVAARAPSDVSGGKMRAIVSKTDAGHTIIDYSGTPADWMKKFSSTRRHAQSFGKIQGA